MFLIYRFIVDAINIYNTDCRCVWFVVNSFSGSYTTIRFYHIEMSFNRPQFCSGALWNPNGTTFADNTTISSELGGIFVDLNDSIYLVMRNINAIRIWYNGDKNSTRTI